MGGMAAICADLAAEHDELDRLVAALDESGWDTPTPAEGWAVRDEISHLAFFDETARLAATDADGFAASVAEAMADPVGYSDAPIERGRAMSGAEVLDWWRRARADVLEVFGSLDPAARIPWYGPAMSAMSFATARLMETWAHGQDVFDAVGAARQPSDRLRHVCHIGVRAINYSFTVHGRPVPTTPVRVELAGPAGDQWSWGEESAPDRVTGDALDFALVVTQRRHLADTGLSVEGPVATEWMSIAQAFAGPAGTGRQPGQFTGRPVARGGEQ
ncbi:MAG TPA: TIGR03084 family metal-binding protein [Acidimicrobiales bacterium]|nr:TIGR03084 family metal-binding protein [Acidimicrobiales bacterium]